MTYEEMLIGIDDTDIIVKEAPLVSSDGRCNGNRIAIRESVPTFTEKACVLAEELGHYYTSTGNIIDLEDVRNRKQELKARLWAYDNKVGLIGLINAFNAGCRNRYEIAEHLGITEQFLDDAVEAYRTKYSVYKVIDNYAVYFIPNLSIVKMI